MRRAYRGARAAITTLAVTTALTAGPAAAAGDFASGPVGSAHDVRDLDQAHGARGVGDPGCRVHIENVRIAAYLSGGRPRDAAVVSAYLACRLTVRNMSLQVTLWKKGLLYDHEQAQTTVRAVAGTHLAGYPAHVTCENQTTSRFYGVAHAVVFFGGRRGDAWVKSPSMSTPRCGT